MLGARATEPSTLGQYDEETIRDMHPMGRMGQPADVGEAAVRELTAEGGSASFVVADVDSQESITDLFDSVMREFGRLDYAVNNAGLAHETKTIVEADPVKFQEMLSTNVMGLFLCMQREIKEMLDSGRGGAIVNLASIVGLNGIPFSGPYAATKHAVVGLTKTAGIEYSGQGVRVNAVAPGAIKTDIIARAMAAITAVACGSLHVRSISSATDSVSL
ncbi:SDR family oxidoreductase [Nocardia sp. NPDC051990]|uniref:SDR family NAD(P)-dependent oxidoreductase n=1 Tax=Nocardia sp. NPDC051990 TaxID=3155285 RepID=UPI00342C72BE